MAINLTTTSTTSLFVFNDWITAARNTGNQVLNFNTSLSNLCPNPLFHPNQWLDPPFNTIPDPLYDPNPTFVSPFVWTNNPFVIGTGANVNDTTFNVTTTNACNADARTFHYEVIQPKVVYERIPNSSDVLFIDVTRKNTYTHRHGIPVTNTTWMQNPYLTRGTIVLQKLVGLVWTTVDRIPLNGTKIVKGLEQALCQYRTIFELRSVPNCGGVSPLVFQSIGDTFSFTAYTYLLPSPTIESVTTAEENKLHWCKIPNDVTDILTVVQHYLTVEVGKDFEVLVKSSNEGYTYLYQLSVAAGMPVLGVDYFEPIRTIQGAFTSRHPMTVHDVVFVGLANEFLDGILITSLNPYTEAIQLQIEGFRTDVIVPIDQMKCSWQTLITDDTQVLNPCLTDKGVVEFEFFSNNVWKLCDTIKPLENVVKDNCEAGLVQFRTRYKYENIIRGCGCDPDKKELVMLSDWYNYSYAVQNWKPSVSLPTTTCCYLVGTAFTITPANLALNNLPANCVAPALANQLTYQVYKWDYLASAWNEVTALATTIPITLPIILTNYNFVLNLTELGDYKIEATVQNCCTTSKDAINVTICNSYEFKKKCYYTTDKCDCEYYEINNQTTATSYYLRIKAWINDVFTTIDEFTVNASTSTNYKLADGIYQIEWFVDNVSSVPLSSTRHYVNCKIQRCYDSYLREIACCNDDTCDDKICQDKRYKLNKILAMYQLYQMRITEANKLNILYINLTIDNDITAIKTIKDLQDKILEFCNPCKNKDCKGEPNSLINKYNTVATSSTGIVSKSSSCGC